MSAPTGDYQPGQVLPGTKYQVIRQLGAGGMGVVYQVTKPPEIQGVLKLMAPELAEHEEFRRRFLDEVRVLAQLDHPNIVKVSDYDATADGTPFYVMELLTGRTVRDVLATIGRVPPRVAFEITRQLCEALHCAHTHTPAVVHRDIKPENIFLHAPRHGDPCVKLIDFGVVAIADRAHDGTFVGTWRYAAPEQIRGERATPATDLYAVGLVLYEMLAGVGPFDHVDTAQLISQAHLRESPMPVSKFAPWVPKSIVDLIASALAKDPRARPRDAYELAERLFELEWANDGQSPRDQTAEGPIARVLSSVATARPESLPQIAVAPDVRHKGPTLPGVGGQDEGTSPGDDELLAALVARPDPRIPSRAPPPRRPAPAGKIVVGPRSRPSSPPGPTAITEHASDTFSSQQAEPRPRRAPVGRLVMPIALGALALAGAAALVILRARQPQQVAVTATASIEPAKVVETSAPVSATPSVSAAIRAATSAATSAAPAASSLVAKAASAPAAPRTVKASSARTSTNASASASAGAGAGAKKGDDGYLRSLE